MAAEQMQMLLSRLTPAIFIALGNICTRLCNLSGRFWFDRLAMRGKDAECEAPDDNIYERGSHRHVSRWDELRILGLDYRCRASIARLAKLSRSAITVTT
jgi:hypothetical protein